jgi:cyclic di-GMP phosphodiesterase
MTFHRPTRNGTPRDEGSELFAPATRVVEALVNAMEAKSPYLRGHSHRVAALAASLATELRLPDEEIEAIRLAGTLHDIGKIGVREAVLDKPGRLTPDEFAHVKEHVAVGLHILAPLPHLALIMEFIAHHHERIDGSGYPAGLSGDAITLGGRILAAADAIDALTSPRAYRDALPLDAAIAKLESLGTRGICPVVLPALARLVSHGQVLVFINDA